MAETFKPLFNRHLLASRMAGFTLELTDQQRQVVDDWATTAADPDFPKQNEKPLQGPFFGQVFGVLLGYTQAIGHLSDYNLKAESASTETRGSKTPDGRLGYFGTDRDITRAVIELKSPAADLDAKQTSHGGLTPVEQAFGYVPKFDGCRWVIVSNFTTVRLYASHRGQAYCHELRLADLTDEESLREFVFLLHKDRLIGEPDRKSLVDALAADTHTKEEAITKEFYAFYNQVRLRLLHQLSRDNPAPDGADAAGHEVRLLALAQKLLDRVLFICFCEDTGLLPHGIIRKAFAAAATGFVQTSRWQQMVGLFHAVDRGHAPMGITGYNGGLFREDPDLESLVVGDDALDNCLKLSDYDFQTDLNVNILGHIFEQSISDLEAIRAEIRGEKIDKKKSKRKKEGVFYTPEFITTFIVQNTIGSWLADRFVEIQASHDPENVRGPKKQLAARIAMWEEYQQTLRHIKVLDPACGSGAFLVAAFDYLAAEYRRVNRQLAGLRGGQPSLFDLDRQILQENLFGVDLNPESVEITKLSLWLKTARTDRPLNDLDDNIKCGNSIIAPPADDASDAIKAAYAGLPEEAKARAFDWQQGFPGVFAQGGFDCVTGNPPYIRQEWLSPYKPYLQAIYATYAGTADLYIYFFERGLEVLRRGGRLGVITSGTFVRANFARPFRQWFPTVARFDRLVNFGENQPFEDAEMVYPTISVVVKEDIPRSFRTLFVHGKIPNSLEAAMAGDGTNCGEGVYRQSEWKYQSSAVTDLLARVMRIGQPLGELAKGRIYRGVLTGLNDAFIIDEPTRCQLAAADSRSVELIKPIARGEDLRPWYQEDEGRWVIFARRGIRIDDYPAVKAHLERFRDRLEPRPTDWQGRSGTWPGRKPGRYEWYELQDSVDYYKAFDLPKLFWPDIAKLPRFSFDDSGWYVNDKGFILTVDSPWILALLQSRVLWFCISQLCVPLRLRAGLWQYQCKKQFITRLPIADADQPTKTALADLAVRATAIARERYAHHEHVRHRLLTDLGQEDHKLNQKLHAWWTIDFATFRKEIKKTLKTDIPVRERSQWEQALGEWQTKHEDLTRQLTDVEAEINDRVYHLYGMSQADVKLLEEHCRNVMIDYRYGEP